MKVGSLVKFSDKVKTYHDDISFYNIRTDGVGIIIEKRGFETRDVTNMEYRVYFKRGYIFWLYEDEIEIIC